MLNIALNNMNYNNECTHNCKTINIPDKESSITTIEKPFIAHLLYLLISTGYYINLIDFYPLLGQFEWPHFGKLSKLAVGVGEMLHCSLTMGDNSMMRNNSKTTEQVPQVEWKKTEVF